MGTSVYNLVTKVFSGATLNPQLTKILLVLISKALGAETIHQFQPISLCNVLYKVISKVIVFQLRHAMQLLVKQNQSSFIVGRNIFDNVIIGQEAIHTMRTTKSKKGWMVVKVNLEKAYARI